MPEPADQPAAQVLVVDDEPDHAEVMCESLRRLGHVCTVVHDLEEARDELRHGQFDLVVTDLVMDADDAGLHVLEAAKKHQRAAQTIVVTAHGDIPTATRALKQGAYHFIEKPLDLEVFRSLCGQAIRTAMQQSEIGELRSRLDETYGFEGIIGQSPPIRRVVQRLKQVAPSQIPVLILGESGSGKELVAQAIHNNSGRARRRFVPLNCAGLNESILEDELFGHVRGAYTGADRDREGRFEYAAGGTLFLDEVGDMPMSMQAKLLRVLESGEVVRVGSNEPRHVDVRLVSATHRDLREMVRDGSFREDLYFRIRGVQIEVPPLRDRPDDVPVLVNHFAARFAEQTNQPVPEISEEVQTALRRYDWPGNVRQLASTVQSMMVIAETPRIELRHIPEEIVEAAGLDEPAPAGSTAGMSLDQIEKHAIRDALQAAGGNREQAARTLGIGERTLYRKLKEYGIR